MSKRTFDPHDLHWGESMLNVPERMGGTRNESAIESFIAETKARAHSFFIQTCGHTARRNDNGEWVSDTCPAGVEDDCREVTAVFFAQPSDHALDEQKLKDMRIIANRLKVPLLVVTHHPYDYEYEFPVRIDRYVKGRRVEHSGDTWDSVGEVLRAEQFHHEDSLAASGGRSSHAHPKCDSRRVGWLEMDTARTPARKGTDLTLSRILREIPGVRHIDIDAAFICENCDKPYCLVEGTSDGLGAREAKPKASFMTRNIAYSFTAKVMLIHHSPNDADLSGEVRSKTFRKGRHDPERDERGDWDVAFSQYDRILDYHQTQNCQGGYRH